jgi:hypothetical protein
VNGELVQREGQDDGVGQNAEIDQKYLVREERCDERRVLPLSLKCDREQCDTRSEVYAVFTEAR